MTPTLLCEFTLPQYSFHITLYRVVRRRDSLICEMQMKDALNNPCWVQVENFGLVMPVGFYEHPVFRDAWKAMARPYPYLWRAGTLVSNLDDERLPTSCRGVCHEYSSRNDHAPSDQHQDFLVLGKHLAADLSGLVEILVPAPDHHKHNLLLGMVVTLLAPK